MSQLAREAFLLILEETMPGKKVSAGQKKPRQEKGPATVTLASGESVLAMDLDNPDLSLEQVTRMIKTGEMADEYLIVRLPPKVIQYLFVMAEKHHTTPGEWLQGDLTELANQ